MRILASGVICRPSPRHKPTTLQLRSARNSLEGEFNSILASPLRFLCSLDHFIRPLKHADWNCQTDLFCCLKVNDEFKLRCLLYGQIGGFGTLQDFVDVVSRLAEQIIVVRPVGHEAA